jgi:hypothetical protein
MMAFMASGGFAPMLERFRPNRPRRREKHLGPPRGKSKISQLCLIAETAMQSFAFLQYNNAKYFSLLMTLIIFRPLPLRRDSSRVTTSLSSDQQAGRAQALRNSWLGHQHKGVLPSRGL